jgi:hypothetical protein
MACGGGLLASRTGCSSYRVLLGFVGAAPCARWLALVVCPHRARGAAPTGGCWYFWEQRPARDGLRWWSARIAHGVRLLQGAVGIFGSSALRAMADADGLPASRTGCGSHRGCLGFVGAAPCARWLALMVCPHRARGAAPTGGCWDLWEQRPARDVRCFAAARCRNPNRVEGQRVPRRA